MKNLPESANEVLNIIVAAERHRKFVWTAGRVLRESALWTQVEAVNFDDRKRVLNRLTEFMDDLAVRGILHRRDEPQSLGYGNEVGFDYICSNR